MTPRQREVLATIIDLTRVNGYPPTIRDIGRELGISSPNGVMSHLRPLRRAGYIEESAGDKRHRGIRLLFKNERCPCCGQALKGAAQ